MVLYKHELRTGAKTFYIWTGVLAFMLFICILIYPQIESQMSEMSEMMANMGSFSAAFGMDRMNYGRLLDYYAIECGNILGIGGALFAAFVGITLFAKEENAHTAEFLLTHPISREKIITEKLLAAGTLVTGMNAAVVLIASVTIICMGEKPDWSLFFLLHLAYYILQLEIAAICTAISSAIHSSGIGIGIGIAIGFYFLNLIANLSDKVTWLKHITPFSYAEAADILNDAALKAGYLTEGLLALAVSVVIAYWVYRKKDIVA